MSISAVVKHVAWMAVALAALTACGGGSGGGIKISSNVDWALPGGSEFTAKRIFSTSVQVESALRLLVVAGNGSVEIIGRPGVDAVGVAAELLVGSDTLLDAEAGLTELDVHVATLPGEILVQTHGPQDWKGRQYVVNYTITLPDYLEVDVRQTNGNIRVEGIVDCLFAKVTNGNIESTAEVRADGDVELSTVNGRVVLGVPTSMSAELSATVGNGIITWDGLDIADVNHTWWSLTGTLGGGEGRIRLETTNGNIDVSNFN